MNNPQIQHVAPQSLRPYAGNARTHSKKQIKQIAGSIERFGFINPLIVCDGVAIAGNGRLQAALQLGLKSIPIIVVKNLSDADLRAYVIADNRLAQNAGWDPDVLAIELQSLLDLGFDDLELTGFSLGEIDGILSDAAEKSPLEPGPEDSLPEHFGAAVSRPGDLWILGAHRLICGDAQNEADYDRVLAGKPADLVLTDPPYNVPIKGHVSGLGKIQHAEFAMASGEMSESEFTGFLATFLAHAKAHSKAAAILFVFMDWRHLFELTVAGRENNLELKNLIVWAKDNAGMGSFYRSKHELCFVFKSGEGSHVNTFELGQHGRYRTNVWEYAGVNTFRAGRTEDLAMHPTVKPTAMIADAIRDVTKRGAVVLDPFAGSGTTLIAAEKTGRAACAIEYDPRFCDVIIRRWQQYTGKAATLEGDAGTFEDVEMKRAHPVSFSTSEDNSNG
ncbi:site-specific DNA-methyltransferase [Nitrobacter sp. TKz-YC02]|uniref:site-specific DNA-methyltransferase n=1 Tax=Nitrobacter sp. TKz-YC02 TaxID=3398704 RepID=UPI003CF131B1